MTCEMCIHKRIACLTKKDIEPAKKEKEDANHDFYYFLLVIAFY
jgi:hypothetical protein